MFCVMEASAYVTCCQVQQLHSLSRRITDPAFRRTRLLVCALPKWQRSLQHWNGDAAVCRGFNTHLSVLHIIMLTLSVERVVTLTECCCGVEWVTLAQALFLYSFLPPLCTEKAHTEECGQSRLCVHSCKPIRVVRAKQGTVLNMQICIRASMQKSEPGKERK